VALEDDLAIRMRGALLGLVSAALFLGDGVFLKGRRLRHELMRYLPHSDLDPARLSVGVAAVGVDLAAVSAAVALCAPTDAWLFHNAFGDILVAMVLIQFAIAHAWRTPTQSADQRRGSPSPT
jgi:intracellular septation protein A